VQVDEIWSFVGAKAKNVKPEHNSDYGDAWTFVAIDADTKLVPSWWVGQRTADDAWEILPDLQGRLASRVQLTTDGHSMYLSAVPGAFSSEIDYAMLIKEYGTTPADGRPRATARHRAPESRSRRSLAHPTRPTSPRRMWSGRT
jgi:IS1 family transposase